MKIADIDLGPRPLLLAPMEDVTDPSFRSICKSFGAAMVYTEFVSADGLLHEARKSEAKLNISDSERPVGIQIYGHMPDTLLQAAIIAEKPQPDVIDINFGCPVRKIAQRGAGSGWLRNPEGMVEITRRIVQTLSCPVTVKTRLGWDEDSKIIVELAEALQDTGIAALSIHGRTRAQMYTGEADWSLIGAVKNNPRMHIPIIGNGDIRTPEDALRAFDTYGVDGIMVGRASFGHPWIFREMRHYIDTKELLAPMSVAQRVELARHHLKLSMESKGEKRGILEMRRHLNCYFKSLDHFKETRIALLTATEPQVIYQLLDKILLQWGESNNSQDTF